MTNSFTLRCEHTALQQILGSICKVDRLIVSTIKSIVCWRGVRRLSAFAQQTAHAVVSPCSGDGRSVAYRAAVLTDECRATSKHVGIGTLSQRPTVAHVNALQLRAAVEHIRQAGIAGADVEARQLQRCQARAAREHIIQIADVLHREAAHIKDRQAATILEHITHIADLGRVPARHINTG